MVVLGKYLIEDNINRERIKRAGYILDMLFRKELKRFEKIKSQQFLQFREHCPNWGYMNA